MGREAKAQVHFRGLTGAAKALLESDALILRGDIRLRVPRGELADWTTDADDLRLMAAGEALVLTLGAREAAAWVRALDRPLPTLAEKLGLSTGQRVLVVTAGPMPDAVARAVEGRLAETAATAHLLLAVLHEMQDLQLALATAKAAALPIWCVHGKAGGTVGGNAVRKAYRDAGWVDTKACAVDENWTAMRLSQRRS